MLAFTANRQNDGKPCRNTSPENNGDIDHDYPTRRFIGLKGFRRRHSKEIPSLTLGAADHSSCLTGDKSNKSVLLA